MSPKHVELSEANQFVERFHRHHKPVRGHRFSVGAEHYGELCGVAIVGRPVARMVDQKNVVEVLRLCTDGTANACSFLYGLTAKIARLLGYQMIQTYILENEPGTSLIASGWSESEATVRGRTWNCPSRGGRREDQPMCNKRKFYKVLNGA